MLNRCILMALMVFSSCSQYVNLYSVQGNSSVSPYNGTFIQTSGVVSGVFQNKGQLGGFYLQNTDSFYDAGIFVKSDKRVNVGDEIELRAKVVEFKNETRLDSVEYINVLSVENKLTEKRITLPISTYNLEKLEGSLVRVENDLILSSSYDFNKYGQILVSTEELFQRTEFHKPSSTLKVNSSNSNLSSILIDDVYNKRYPMIDSLYCDKNNLIVDAVCSDIVGYVSQNNDTYRIRTNRQIRVESNLELEKQKEFSCNGALKIMSFNLHNLFNGDGRGGGFPTSRGAKSYSSYQLQLHKISCAINGVNPDIVGLIEMENDLPDSLSSCFQLCEKLNKDNPNRKYVVSMSSNRSKGDVIKNALIYDENVVSPESNAVYYNDDLFSRAPLFQKFKHKSNSFVVSVNHFKSKSPRGAQGFNVDQKDGQASYNYKRVKQSEQLLLLIDSIYSSDNLIVMGDFNAYTMEEPIELLGAGILTRCVAEGYSYEYKGRKGNLDHVFVSHDLQEDVAQIITWDINSSYPNWIDYRHQLADSSFYRSSDHNPIIIGIY